MRPRGQAWGNESQRAVLHALAEDIARRSGHRVAAIAALRSDGNLEFVAIAGSPVARERLLGRAAPLALEHLVGAGVPIAGWVHVPAENIGDSTRAWMEQYGHTPDLPLPERPGDWHPQDRLVRLLENEDGELRATLYLDEPLDGRRPTEAVVEAVNAEIQVAYEAIVSIVERELYGEQVRMVTQARTAMRSVRPGLAMHEFLRKVSAAMVEAMHVDTVDVLLAGDSAPSLEGHRELLEEHMRQAWLRRGHLVLEPERSWGVTDGAVPTPAVMSDLMAARGIGSWLLVPIGLGEEYLGTMGLGRSVGGARWIDSEINAAAAVASDLAGVVVDARLMERERTLNAELRGVSDYRRDMVVTLSHELRNPLSVLFTHLELLAEESHTEQAQESLDALGRATRRIEDMVEDLMALASTADREHGSATGEVDLSGLVRESSEFLASMAAHAGVELRLRVADGLVLAGDGAGLQRMVTNLLSNAFKYTPPGGHVTLTAESRASGDRDGVLLTCADTGIGIDASEVEQVFAPFYRSRSSEARLRPGTGLGLAIVESVVERHRGTVSVESVVGEGTTFTVWLPLVPDHDVA
ncbi:hypothetical protein GCM10023339_19310 [Alloalcanivorax gelatiniphagus]